MTGALARGSIAVIALVAAGCASTPQAPQQQDVEAKRFLSDRRLATVYVYRADIGRDPMDDPIESVLYADDRLIGSTLPGTFFVVRLSTGVHTLSGFAHDQGRLKIDVLPGENYFVSLSVESGQSWFRRVSVETGERELRAFCSRTGRPASARSGVSATAVMNDTDKEVPLARLRHPLSHRHFPPAGQG